MAHNPPHILVTAGPTREKIDKVRDWGNIFSGKTGLDLALAFLKLGNVTLLTSNQRHADEYDGYSGAAGMLGIETFSTHAHLHALLEERMTSGDPIHVVAMTAAVADYKPIATYKILHRAHTADAGGGKETWTVENVSAPKVKSTHTEIAVAATATPKLIDMFRTQWNYRGLLIKFKLEVDITEDELIKVASASRLTSAADLIVANTLAMTQPESGTPSGAYLIDNDGANRTPRALLAESILQWTHAHLKK
ncbi:MAG: phosphopantothenoylcysteine decarboxylase domain-containing protein [Phycisphaerae bacterium]